MKKLPRLWDEKIQTASGREVRRFRIRRSKEYRFMGREQCEVWDLVKAQKFRAGNPANRFWRGAGVFAWFRTRKAAEHWLKKTTVRSWKIQQVEKKLDQGAT